MNFKLVGDNIKILMLTDLFQFIEPLSDWSLHLLLHLSSEQLEPLRGHHLDNTHIFVSVEV